MLMWDDIVRDCRVLAKQIKSCDAIIAIGRGGFVPGTILSYSLNTALTTFLVKTYNNYAAETTEIKEVPSEDFITKYKNKKNVVIDDLSDRGTTLLTTKKFLEEKGFTNLIFATLYVKTSTKFIPNHYVTKFDDSLWLDFPWEIC